MRKKAIIIGAGPAGLTAAYELLKRTDILPIIIEKDKQVGGISKTVDYKGNKMDFGPHRFFSKSDRVMNWWTNIMPLHTPKGEELTISYQNKSRKLDTGDFLTTEDDEQTNGLPPKKSMLIIPRLTRIYFLRQFFVYPIQLSIATLGQLGIWTTIKIVFSYLYARLFPRKPENSLEDFMINKFGSVLYHIFFKDYTEKVWGIDCRNISADWGAQRVKGVSLSKAVLHAAKALTKHKKKKAAQDINQKDTETSLIEQFLYPATGAGAMWEEVARQVVEMGGKIVTHYDVKHLRTEGDQIIGIEALNTKTGELEQLEGDYFISTMPVQELIAGLKANVPAAVKEVAEGLLYRDFVYAGVLVKKMTMETPKDSWIYIQERDVKVARMQVYNNWGPYMVADPNTVWLGLEYFCTKGDEIWNLTDEQVQKLAVEELIKMDLVVAEDVLDSKVNRMEKTYPAYFGTYDRFEEIQQYLANFTNLFLVGRNGMHKYNNTDHSMLTAMVAVDNIEAGVLTKENLWEINTEQEYHEVKKERKEATAAVEPMAGGHVQPGALLQKAPPTLFAFMQEPQNKRMLWVMAGLSALLFILFKYIYPYPSFINGDSYVYIESAAVNKSTDTYPVGYPQFLRLFSVFSKSHWLLVTVQFITLQAAMFFLAFTLFYYLRPGNVVRWIIAGFLIFNPLFYYMANCVSSDVLFLTLSVAWFTTTIWMIFTPSLRLFLLHGVLIFLCFTVRYNALYYPIISILALLFSKAALRHKLVAVVVPVCLIGAFVINTGYRYQQLTKTWQFSPFTGWQLANNVLYAYRTVDSVDRKPVPARFNAIHKQVNDYFRAAKDTARFPHEKITLSTFYMWSGGMPLMDFMNITFHKDTVSSVHKRWASMGPLYKDYASLLIRQYPGKYAQHYLWPNLVRFYAPPEEFLLHDASGKDSILPRAREWFGIKSGYGYNKLGGSNQPLLRLIPILSGTTNLVFLLTCICMVLMYGINWRKDYGKVMLIVIAFWLVNLGFSVFASPITLRYQIFPFVVSFCSMLIILEILIRTAIEREKQQEAQRAFDVHPA